METNTNVANAIQDSINFKRLSESKAELLEKYAVTVCKGCVLTGETATSHSYAERQSK